MLLSEEPCVLLPEEAADVDVVLPQAERIAAAERMLPAPTALRKFLLAISCVSNMGFFNQLDVSWMAKAFPCPSSQAHPARPEGALGVLLRQAPVPAPFLLISFCAIVGGEAQ